MNSTHLKSIKVRHLIWAILPIFSFVTIMSITAWQANVPIWRLWAWWALVNLTPVILIVLMQKRLHPIIIHIFFPGLVALWCVYFLLVYGSFFVIQITLSSWHLLPSSIIPLIFLGLIAGYYWQLESETDKKLEFKAINPSDLPEFTDKVSLRQYCETTVKDNRLLDALGAICVFAEREKDINLKNNAIVLISQLEESQFSFLPNAIIRNRIKMAILEIV